MVEELSNTRGADEMTPKATPQPPAVEPGLLYIGGTWRDASDGATGPTTTQRSGAGSTGGGDSGSDTRR